MYWGETARSAKLRGGEHWSDFRTEKESSHMRQHLREKHPETDQSGPAETYFEMEIHRRYQTALERQLGEALCISRAGGGRG